MTTFRVWYRIEGEPRDDDRGEYCILIDAHSTDDASDAAVRQLRAAHGNEIEVVDVEDLE